MANGERQVLEGCSQWCSDLLKALGIHDKYVTRAVITMEAKDIVTVEVTRYATTAAGSIDPELKLETRKLRLVEDTDGC